ncbi:hypothetical protein JAO73_22410 [Hymenobacter sp. BT523]|uniref:hypothetical protein n=1 Tax=Hymenobacter sp. BT523 TaxID=2795725 RepID=UPI0018EA47DC|nr:hypothetical protein [Hymenobacter sp. BT523]MBJ6111790.1 hypothetical protein [Hymenobacter sp. BT523]
MIQFIKTESFIQRIWSVTLSISIESIRSKFLHFDEKALREEQVELKSQYNKFLLELEYNIKFLSTDNYAQFFNELDKVFLIPISILTSANQLLESLIMQHGSDYQIFAWRKMKQELSESTDKDEVIPLCINLILVATGGATFYQKAYADVQRQRRILLGAPNQKIPASAALVAFVEKHVPSLSQVEPKQTDGKLSLRQIALLHIYQGRVIPKAADEIAKAYGHNSGAKLYGHYLKLSSRTGRTGDDIKGQRLASMLDAISRLLPFLDGAAYEQAKRELTTLEARN